VDLVLIRHAQSSNNHLWAQTGGTSGRDPEPDLTELGEQQAEALAQWARSSWLAPRAIYSSLMTRALRTAAPLAQALDVALIGHSAAYEVGGPYVEDDEGVRRHHPGIGRDAAIGLAPTLSWPDDVEPGSWWSGPVEDGADAVRRRAANVIADLDRRHPGEQQVALVTHGFFTQFLVQSLLGIPDMTGWIRINNTGVSRIHVDGTVRIAVDINRLDHLTGDQITD
jgi:2,3-bisphosphoglycerate-dependent phosphoglycerate mutase